MSKTFKSIKEILDLSKNNLLEDELYQSSHKQYLKKLDEVYDDNIIELNDPVENIIELNDPVENIIELTELVEENHSAMNTNDTAVRENNNIIHLNNELLNQDKVKIEEFNNGLTLEKDESIIDLIEEATDEDSAVVDLSIIESNDPPSKTLLKETKETNETVPVKTSNDQINESIVANQTNETVPVETSNDQINESIVANQTKIDQLEENMVQVQDLTNKVQDIENQNNLLFDKFDDLVNQNLNLSDKLANDLDLKLDLSVSKIEEESSLKYQALDEKLINIETQTKDLKENIVDFQTQLSTSINNISNENKELLDTVNTKINAINEINSQAIIDLKIELGEIEPKIIKSLEEKQKNKTESEKLQEKFNEITKVLDMQNMRMSQLYHSNELKSSYDILQKNLQTNNNLSGKNLDTDSELSNKSVDNIIEELKRNNDKNFEDIKKQISKYEIKDFLDKTVPEDIETKLENSSERFDNLHDAREYVTTYLSNRTNNWIEKNQHKIDEISKKLLDN